MSSPYTVRIGIMRYAPWLSSASESCGTTMYTIALPSLSTSYARIENFWFHRRE